MESAFSETRLLASEPKWGYTYSIWVHKVGRENEPTILMRINGAEAVIEQCRKKAAQLLGYQH
jgi:hypothetical protein